MYKVAIGGEPIFQQPAQATYNFGPGYNASHAAGTQVQYNSAGRIVAVADPYRFAAWQKQYLASLSTVHPTDADWGRMLGAGGRMVASGLGIVAGTKMVIGGGLGAATGVGVGVAVAGGALLGYSASEMSLSAAEMWAAWSGSQDRYGSPLQTMTGWVNPAYAQYGRYGDMAVGFASLGGGVATVGARFVGPAVTVKGVMTAGAGSAAISGVAYPVASLVTGSPMSGMDWAESMYSSSQIGMLTGPIGHLKQIGQVSLDSHRARALLSGAMIGGHDAANQYISYGSVNPYAVGASFAMGTAGGLMNSWASQGTNQAYLAGVRAQGPGVASNPYLQMNPFAYSLTTNPATGFNMSAGLGWTTTQQIWLK
ncbi:MAG: hypothetical protein HS115_08890 [Spirochaetales bacterium]|nr:hypothetical protein [Spirochaetales bacterium]